MADRYEVFRMGAVNWSIHKEPGGERVAVVYGGSLERARDIAAALETMDVEAVEPVSEAQNFEARR